MSPSGRKIHEAMFRMAGFVAPVAIGILETPTGFEVNAIHGWPERMQKFFEKSLANYKPVVSRIRAWRRDEDAVGTNNSAIVDAILNQDYLYCGAGSPLYTVKHLSKTRAYANLLAAHREGVVLCLGSATAVAMSRWAIPVYEIFKTGADLRWAHGLDFFHFVHPDLAIVPHWNNQEGEDFDTTRCWMGKERFKKLQKMLPKPAVILGIDEQTACVIDVSKKTITIRGIGNAYILRGDRGRTFPSGSVFLFSDLS